MLAGTEPGAVISRIIHCSIVVNVNITQKYFCIWQMIETEVTVSFQSSLGEISTFLYLWCQLEGGPALFVGHFVYFKAWGMQ